ncbi:hypothetical protein [Tropicimonas aquimaris]|uniref:Uncharacterized protein n=1 Tax=Tropicimonas aquimaris TaxID=914152 RepID=A0ABW3IPH9_9RHOB
MTSLTLSPTGLFARFLSFPWGRTEGERHISGTDVAADDMRAKRDFIQDMIERNPDAFSSNLDIQTAMLVFPESF